MGTRSLTILMDGGVSYPNKATEIVVMYRQYDGYPSGHGAELAQFLSGFTITNGIGDLTTKTANGAECLAAQIVAHFKNESGVGGIYLQPANTRNAGEEYRYFVYAEPGQPITILVYDVPYDNERGKLLFEGTPEELYSWANKPDKQE